MTTFVGSSYNVNRNSLSNAEFQTICTKIKEALDGCGLVQTADTGQLDPSTVNYPGSANTEAGYLIYRFDDAQQGSDPIVFRVALGRGTSHAGSIYYRLTVGQGSDGSGTITGQTVGPLTLQSGYNNSTGTTTDYEMSCHTTGYAAHFSRVANNLVPGPCVAFWTITRLRDQLTGAFNAKGFLVTYRPENGSTTGVTRWVSVRTASPATTYSATRSNCVMPGAPASTILNNGDKQLYPHFYNIPDIEQSWSSFTTRYDEIANNPTTFTAAPQYGETRTFLQLGYNPTTQTWIAANSVDSTSWVPNFLWE